jgi:ssDNA-specific exonuclease RecJ
MEDASVAVELVLSDDPGKVREIVEKLNYLNSQRQNEESEILEQAKEMLGRERVTSTRCIVLSSENWNPGIIGIAASRLTETYNRPAILFSEKDGILTGSGRTAAGLDLYELLTHFKDRFLRFGGHAGAAGVTMRKTEFDSFRENLNEYLISNYPADRFAPALKYELKLKLSEITESLVRDIERLAPFGEGNPVPLICTEPVELESIRVIGERGDHLKVSVKQDVRLVEAVAFGKGDKFFDYSTVHKAKLVFSPVINEWKNAKQIQLQIKAIERLPIMDPAEYIKKHEQKFYDAISRNILYNDMREIGQVKAVDSDKAFRLFTDSDIAGTLVLCFTPLGAERFLEKTGSGWSDIRFFAHDEDLNAYNAVIFAPVIEKLKLSRYDRILVYDCCFSTGMIAELARHAKVYVSDKVSEGLSVAEKFMVRRDELKKHYGALNSLSRSGVMTKAEILKLLEQSTGSPSHIARLALDIFEELGFVENDIEAGWSVVNMSRRRSLDESKRFSIANSMAKMLQEYSLSIKTIQENQYGS